MPLQHSPPERQKRSQAQAQAVLTPTPRAPLDGIPEVRPLKAQLDRGPIKEGAAPSRKEGRVPRRSNSFSGVVGHFPGMSRTTFRGPGEDGEQEKENSVEEEGSDGTEASPAPVGTSEGTIGPTLAQSDQPISHQTKPSLLAIMQKMTQIMANLQAAASSEVSRPPAFKTPSMKAPECFDGTQPFKVRTWNFIPGKLRQKENNHHQEKKPEASKSNSSHHQNSSSSSNKKKNFHSQKWDKPHSSLLNKDFKLKGSEKERRIKEGLCTYYGGKHSIESCVKISQNSLPNHQAIFPAREKPE
ncbi:hypothetical protein O181_022127 [Austropuccinia psidii MF-1]|uniref:Uncharacterized protein n=1 Tax=Austropuccinia psidii MF-1 TaxID=1389203 RepID=A0A9Q3GWU9_9BASI|nr:hypothetical protein [Austropuccinia psidii MF-1]